MAQFNMHTFKPGDFSEFMPQKMQRDEYNNFVEKGIALLEYIENERNTVTIEKNGKTICVFGIFPLKDNGCHGWLFFSDGLKGNDLVVAIRMLEGAVLSTADMGYEWMQTPVRVDFEEGERMIKMLGFEPTDVTEDLLEDGTIYRYWMRVF